jgi:O-antigen/teichoic acid export membrane protein
VSNRILTAIRAQVSDPLNRGWATIFSGTLARLALGFIASVLIVRTLGPAGFGIYATLGVVASIGGALADLGLSTAAVRRIAEVWISHPALAQERAKVFLALRLAIAATLCVTSLLVAAPLATVLPGRPSPPLVLLALLGMIATNLSGTTSVLLQATGAFRSLSLVLVVNSGLTALLAVGLASAGWLSITTALAILGIGTSLVSLAMGWWMGPLRRNRRTAELTGDPRPKTEDPNSESRSGDDEPPATSHQQQATSNSSIIQESRALLLFGGWLWVANGFAMLASSLDVLLVGRWLPAASIGQYTLASNLAGKADIVNQSLHAVLLPAASQLGHSGAVRGYIRQNLLRSAALSLLLIPLLPLAPLLVGLIYGPAFTPAAGLFQVLLGVAIFDIWVTPLLLLAYPANRPRLLAAADALRVGALLLSGTLLIPTLGLPGAALARLCARVAGAVLILLALWLPRQ